MIDFININKSFTDKDILVDATFRVNPGERVGLVGPNGAGKSTIFNMITGVTEPDRGQINLPGKFRTGYLKQQLEGADVNKELAEFVADGIPELNRLKDEIQSVEARLADAPDERLVKRLGQLQTEFENLDGYAIVSKAEQALAGLGFGVDEFTRPLDAFSGGWQMRASLARTMITDPDILLLDEPSNYLDVPAIEWMRRYLKGFRGTLLLISHDRFLLTSLTTTIIEVNGGLVNRYPGNYDYYIKERENRFQSLAAAKKNQDKRKDQLQSSINRFRAKSTKAAQVQSWIKEIDKMEEIAIPDSLAYSGTIRIPNPPPSGAEVLRLEQVGHTYDNEKWILRNVDMCIERGDKIAVVGYNGMGKTTLLRIIAGQMAPADGKRVLGHKAVTGYQAQDFAEILTPGKSVYNVIRSAAPADTSDKDVRRILGSFGFQGDATAKPCGVLSGGEKIRLAFARIFINPPNLLILDEPTTHLDIAAREALQQAVCDYPGTVCMVSHDIEFIRRSATTIYAMNGKLGVVKYYGDYTYYRSKIDEIEDADIAASGKKSAESSARPPKLDKKEERRRKAAERQKKQGGRGRLEREAAELESQIEAREKERGELLELLADNAGDLNYAEMNKKLKDIEIQITWSTDKWNQVAEKIDELTKKDPGHVSS